MFKLEVTVPFATLEFDKKNLKKALRTAAKMVVKRARASMQGTQPSKPGEPPARRTGVLAKSIKVRSGKGLSVLMQDNAEHDGFYARFLETGAQGGGGKKGQRNKRASVIVDGRKKSVLVQVVGKRRLEPRPFLSAALEASQSDIQSQISASIASDFRLVDGRM